MKKILRNAGLVLIGLVAVLLVGFWLTPRGFLVRESKAVAAAEDQGFSQVRVTSAHRLSPKMVGGCGSGDDAAFEIDAVNPAGRAVKATVCCGAWFKGCTVRSR